MHYPEISCCLIAILHAKFTLLHNKANIYIYIYTTFTPQIKGNPVHIYHISH